MSQSYSDVTVHIAGKLSPPMFELVMDSLGDARGVKSLSTTGNQPYLVVVKYDASETTSLEIFGAVTRLGCRGGLVGL